MPAFADPFYGNLPPKKMDLGELIRAIRFNIAAEHEATAIYTAHADATDNPVAKKVLLDIANEERVHVGEFIELLEILTQEEKAWMENGYNEVRELAAEVAKGDLEPATPAGKAAEEGEKSESVEQATIGSMKEG